METRRYYNATRSRLVVLIKICHCSQTAIVLTQDNTTDNAYIHTYIHTHTHTHTDETCVGGGKGANSPSYIFLPKNIFGYSIEKGQIKGVFVY